MVIRQNKICGLFFLSSCKSASGGLASLRAPTLRETILFLRFATLPLLLFSKSLLFSPRSCRYLSVFKFRYVFFATLRTLRETILLWYSSLFPKSLLSSWRSCKYLPGLNETVLHPFYLDLPESPPLADLRLCVMFSYFCGLFFFIPILYILFILLNFIFSLIFLSYLSFPKDIYLPESPPLADLHLLCVTLREKFLFWSSYLPPEIFISSPSSWWYLPVFKFRSVFFATLRALREAILFLRFATLPLLLFSKSFLSYLRSWRYLSVFIFRSVFFATLRALRETILLWYSSLFSKSLLSSWRSCKYLPGLNETVLHPFYLDLPESPPLADLHLLCVTLRETIFSRSFPDSLKDIYAYTI